MSPTVQGRWRHGFLANSSLHLLGRCFDSVRCRCARCNLRELRPRSPKMRGSCKRGTDSAECSPTLWVSDQADRKRLHWLFSAGFMIAHKRTSVLIKRKFFSPKRGIICAHLRGRGRPLPHRRLRGRRCLRCGWRFGNRGGSCEVGSRRAAAGA